MAYASSTASILQRLHLLVNFAHTNSPYLTLKSLIASHALIVAKKSVRSGKSSWGKRRLNATRYTNVNRKNFLNKPENPCKMKEPPRLWEEMDTSQLSSSSIIINNNSITLIINNTMVASPLKVVGDQHRTHLKLMEELKAIIAIWIITTQLLKNRLINKPKQWLLNTWKRLKQEIINRMNKVNSLKKVMIRSSSSTRLCKHP